jgi:undecaprenyl-diphosphatase
VGIATLAVAGSVVKTDRVGPVEAGLFRSVNALSDRWAGPVWIVMQGGALATVPAAAAAAWACGRPTLARRLLIGGVTTWGLAKVVKLAFQRPRPARLLTQTRRRGRNERGLGFVSGHAGVAASLCSAALPEFGPGGRRAAVAAAVSVAAARLYVGAHLPLDVLGGAALGVAIEAAVELGEACCTGRAVVTS